MDGNLCQRYGGAAYYNAQRGKTMQREEMKRLQANGAVAHVTFLPLGLIEAIQCLIATIIASLCTQFNSSTVVCRVAAVWFLYMDPYIGLEQQW